jgi:hypothetical protein
MIKRRSNIVPPTVRNQTYNSIREALEHENAELIRERQNIMGRMGTQQYPGNSYPPQHPIAQLNGVERTDDDGQAGTGSPMVGREPLDKVTDVCSKIEEVIAMCGYGSKEVPNQPFREVAEAEKQILDFLSNSNGGPAFTNQHSDRTNSQHKQTQSMI